MATHSSILAWKITWTEEPGGLQSMESQESSTTEHIAHTHTHTHTHTHITHTISKIPKQISNYVSQVHKFEFHDKIILTNVFINPSPM